MHGAVALPRNSLRADVTSSWPAMVLRHHGHSVGCLVFHKVSSWHVSFQHGFTYIFEQSMVCDTGTEGSHEAPDGVAGGEVTSRMSSYPIFPEEFSLFPVCPGETMRNCFMQDLPLSSSP